MTDARSEAMRSFFEETSVMMAVVELETEDFRYITVNTASAQHVGLTPDRVESRTATEIGIPRAVLDAWLPLFRRALETGERIRTGFSARGRAMSSVIIPLSDAPNGRPRFGFITEDVTDQRLMQEQLELAERRALVGCVAAGAAHEIKNPLSFARANLVFAIRTMKENDPEQREEVIAALEETSEGLTRIGAVAKDLLSLSRSEPSELSVVDLTGIVERAVSLTKTEIYGAARLELKLQDVPSVRVHAVRLEQVLLNLILNAVEAIRSTPAREHVLAVRTARIPQSAVIEVEDTGCGIPPENLERIFDPFFTTKGPSGTGLGLSIAADAIRSMGGTLSVVSEVGRGTTFRISLPEAAQPETAPHRQQREASPDRV